LPTFRPGLDSTGGAEAEELAAAAEGDELDAGVSLAADRVEVTVTVMVLVKVVYSVAVLATSSELTGASFMTSEPEALCMQ
jgi:hypothetical protein